MALSRILAAIFISEPCIMPLRSDCHVYNKWVEEDVIWTVEDLDPKDDNLVSSLMVEYFMESEILTSRLGLKEEKIGREHLENQWKEVTSQRTSLACYRLHQGVREIAAVNVCPIKTIDDPSADYNEIESESLKRLHGCLDYCEKYVDLFKVLNVNTYLSGFGLLVLPQFRGSKLGAKVLDAREPLCRRLGIQATATIFTGIASQKLAERCGFETILERSFEQLKEKGFYFPGDQTKTIKLMVKKYK